MIKKPLAAIEGNGGFMDFKGFWPEVLLPLCTQALLDLVSGKGSHLRAKRATEPQEEVFLTSKLISTVGLV